MTLGPIPNPASRAVAGRTAYLILHNTSEVVTPDPEGRALVRYPKGAVVFQDGHVLEVGNASELLRRHGEARPITILPPRVSNTAAAVCAARRARTTPASGS